MRSRFIEIVEVEQRVALVALVVRRLGELNLLNEEAAATESAVIARMVVGETDMDATEKWAVVNAAVSLLGRAAEATAIVTHDTLVPAVKEVAMKTTTFVRKSKYITQRKE